MDFGMDGMMMPFGLEELSGGGGEADALKQTEKSVEEISSLMLDEDMSEAERVTFLLREGSAVQRASAFHMIPRVMRRMLRPRTPASEGLNAGVVASAGLVGGGGDCERGGGGGGGDTTEGIAGEALREFMDSLEPLVHPICASDADSTSEDDSLILAAATACVAQLVRMGVPEGLGGSGNGSGSESGSGNGRGNG